MNSIGRQILVASISVLLLLVGSSALIVRELNGWDVASAYVMRDYRRALLDGEFEEALTRATGETANYVLTGTTDYRSEAVAALERANKAVAMLREIAGAGPVHPGDLSHFQFLERQERLLRSTQESVNKVASAMPAAGTADAAEKLRQIYAHEAEADVAWLDIVAHHMAERLENEQTLRSHSRRARMLVLASVAVLTVWIGLLVGYVRKDIVEPLAALARLTASIGAGDLMRSAPVTHTHRNEIGQLQRSFNQMVVNLAQQRRDLAALVERLSLARDVAETANRAKANFLANVSHELRTPMNGVIVTLDLMHETAPNQEQRDLTDLARASAHGLRGMLNDLLDFSRIEAGKLEVRSAAFDLRQLVTQMVELHGKRAAAKGLAMTCNIAAEIPTKLCGDPMRLGQVLLNLLDNAIKFTERGSIDVSVAVDAPPTEPTPSQETAHVRPVWLRFRVTDTGIGVPAEAAQKIFQPFYQAERSTTRSYAGMGLGLGIARKLAQRMGGELGFESEVGKGSIFWFTARLLPEAQPGEAAPPESLTPRQLPAGSRVLLVEDNRDNREVMARVLERRGLRVTPAENGRHALACAATEKFDVILMDCRMPEMDGFDATRAIRALGGEYAEVPIIALTAYSLNGQTQRYLDAGFTDLLAKPYTVQEIEAVLYRWLVLERRDGVLPPGAKADGGSAAR